MEATKEKYLGIQIDYSRDDLLDEQAKTLLAKYYMLGHETSPQQAFARASTAYCFGDYELAQRIYDYASKRWFMFASPVLSNAPEIDWGKTFGFGHARRKLKKMHKKGLLNNRGMPISCFLNYVPDNIPGLVSHSAETRWLSVLGGGVGGHWRNVRSMSASIKKGKGGKAPGIIPFLHTIDSDMVAYHQGSTRRGSYAAYIDIDHPEVLEYLEMRIPSGDINRKNINMHHGINYNNKFVEAVRNDEMWQFIDPKEKVVKSEMPARKLWERIIKTRFRTGEPFLINIDLAMEQFPQALKNRGLQLNGSNLCFAPGTMVTVSETNDVANAVPFELPIEDVVERVNNGEIIYALSYEIDEGGWSVGDYTFSRITAGSLIGSDQDVITLTERTLDWDGNEITRDVVCTPTHQFFVDGTGWVNAEDLPDVLNESPEDLLTATAYDVVESGTSDVYDITVEDTHNFIANGFLVHNCTEIFLATDENRTAVCCLSSAVLEYYPEWKDTMLIEDATTLLDNVIEYFIIVAPDVISRAIFSAESERSIGLGFMGFHSYLQRMNLPWECAMAKSQNMAMFKTIKAKAVEQTKRLAIQRGEPVDMRGTGRRNAHLLAIAPNSNNSIIVGTSPSIEPSASNAYVASTRAGNFLVKNKYLENLMNSKFDEAKVEELWQRIISNDGSIQGMSEFTPEEQEVFKTSLEIDQHWLVEFASDRQADICQGQSLNLFFKPKENINYVMSVHWKALNSNIKSLYYLRTRSEASGEKVEQKVERKVLGEEECLACEG